LLGYGDGKIRAYDLRKLSMVFTATDPVLRAVGEIRFDR